MKNSFRYAFRRSIPILIGFFPVGVAYGILMADAGYHFLWSFFASLVIYAGSLQMLMVSFFTGALPLVTVALTALLLNSRHIFYGLSFIEKFKSYGRWRWLLIYGLTDEAYSLLCSYEAREDVEEKWVVAPEGMRFSAEEILAAVAFQEQYFQIQLRMEKTT